MEIFLPSVQIACFQTCKIWVLRGYKCAIKITVFFGYDDVWFGRQVTSVLLESAASNQRTKGIYFKPFMSPIFSIEHYTRT